MAKYKIVVPLDGSRLAEHPLAYLSALNYLGDKGDTSVTLLSAIDINERYPGLNEVESRERASNLMASYLREVAGDVREHACIEVETRMVTGLPDRMLAAAGAPVLIIRPLRTPRMTA